MTVKSLVQLFRGILTRGVSVEVSNSDFTIAVDSKRFVSNPEAKITLDGAMAVLTYALMTGEHEKLNLSLCRLLTQLMYEYKESKPKGWRGDKDNAW